MISFVILRWAGRAYPVALSWLCAHISSFTSGGYHYRIGRATNRKKTTIINFYFFPPSRVAFFPPPGPTSLFYFFIIGLACPLKTLCIRLSARGKARKIARAFFFILPGVFPLFLRAALRLTSCWTFSRRRLNAIDYKIAMDLSFEQFRYLLKTKKKGIYRTEKIRYIF